MGTNDFAIKASKPLLDKKFEFTMKFIDNFHGIGN